MKSSKKTEKSPKGKHPKKNVSRKKSVSPTRSDEDLDVDVTILDYVVVFDKKSELN